MAFSTRTFSSIEDWASKVPPAPRCRECDQPMGLGDFTNSGENRHGQKFSDLEGGYLCRDCAVHEIDQTWQGPRLLCTRQPPKPHHKTYDKDFEAPNCHDCRREREREIYLKKVEAIRNLPTGISTGGQE